MSGGRQKASWNHTSALMALLANVNRSKGQRAFQPGDFHPFTTEQRARTVSRDDVSRKTQAFDVLRELGGTDLVEVEVGHFEPCAGDPSGLAGAQEENQLRGASESDEVRVLRPNGREEISEDVGEEDELSG